MRMADSDQQGGHPDQISSISVVCTGNICRSPMGEVMLSEALADTHPGVTVMSCGIANYHVGDGADPRAVKQLESMGYDGSQHVASQFGKRDAEADLLLAMDRGHARELMRLGVPSERIRLFRSFDGDSMPSGDAQPEVCLLYTSPSPRD